MGIEALVGASIGLSAIGTGVQTIGAMNAAEKQKEIARLEQQQQEQQRKAMELAAHRQQTEAIRNQQRARAMALTAATSQGAQYSSSLQAAYGQISGAGTNNLLGINQNLEIGRNVAGINSQISDNRIGLAGDQSMVNFGQGFSSLGGSLMSAVPVWGRLTGSNVGGSGFNFLGRSLSGLY